MPIPITPTEQINSSERNTKNSETPRIMERFLALIILLLSSPLLLIICVLIKINSNELLTEYLRKNINTSIENLSVRLCDFGLSSTLEKSFLLSTRCGSPAWIAPEVMVGRFYDQRIDIYAFGLVMWEIMVGLFYKSIYYCVE